VACAHGLDYRSRRVANGASDDIDDG
jgi:hypothetical protein